MRRHDPTPPTPAVLFISFAAVPKKRDAEEMQRRVGQRRADELNLRFVHEIVEMGASALSFKNRLAFRALFNYFDDHPDVRHVMFPSIGRVSKSWRNLDTILKEFDARGIHIVTFDGRIASSAEVASRITAGAHMLMDFEEVKRAGRATDRRRADK